MIAGGSELARTAERGMFDFVVVQAPGTFTVLAALAGMTEHIGLVGTIEAEGHEPFEVSRQFATLDHLSDGRAGWNMVTPAAEFLTVVREFWDSWELDAVLADLDAGIYADPHRIHSIEHTGQQYRSVRGMATLPAGPQGYPVLLCDGDSEAGTVFGAEHADVVITVSAAQPVAHDRNPNHLKVFASLTFAPGDSATNIAEHIDRSVQSEACDGFIVPADRLEEVVDRVVPLLQERGVFRTEYRGATLRENLGLTSARQPARPVPGSDPATPGRGRV